MTSTTPTTALADLLPCPFCKSQLEPFGPSQSNHPRNDCWLSSVAVKREEFERWNRRAAQPVAPVEMQTVKFNAERMAHLINRLSVANRRDGWAGRPEYNNADRERAMEAVDVAERNLLDYVKSLATPSPQIAEVAELPPLPEPDGSASVPVDESSATFTEVDAWSEELVRQAQRDAIAASRRAARGEASTALREAARDYANGAEWVQRSTVVAWLRARAGFATPAPASAGQAAPALPIHQTWASSYDAWWDVDKSTYDRTEEKWRRIVFAAQPAEGAGQASWAAEEGNRHARIYLAGKAAGWAEGAGQAAPMQSAAKKYRAQIAEVVHGTSLPPLERGELTLAIADLLDDALAAQPAEGAGQSCVECGGSGVVDDGEIDCYPNGEPYANGPVKCVKDCPSCSKQGKVGAGKAGQVAQSRGGVHYIAGEFQPADVKPLAERAAAPAELPDDWQAAIAEVERATIKFPTWPTDPLHAVAVLGEEFGELTKAVLQTTYEPHKVQPGELRTEAIQTAAMSLRFLASLKRYEFAKCAQHKQGGE